jgi:LAO/AO transport system kinase
VTSGDVADLVAGVVAGHVPSIARAITALESHRASAADLGELVWQAGGRARVVGLTGAPGSGKSTLTNALVRELRSRGRRVAVLAVDPSSSLSGGAILGDRIRLSGLTEDRGVYVRSLSTRGSLGGVSRATVDAVAVVDAAGFDDVIVETVGVGQAEVDVVRIAQTVLVVSVPGLGDDVQMLKAGLLELADVHVVNKADRPGADKVVAEIHAMLSLGASFHGAGWHVPLVETVATAGDGAPALVDAIDAHDRWLGADGRREAAMRRSADARIREVAKDLLLEWMSRPGPRIGYEAVVESVVQRRRSPYAAAREVLARSEQLEEIP